MSTTSPISHGCGAMILASAATNPHKYLWETQIKNGEQDKVLLLQRGYGAPTFPGAWVFPAGLLEIGETPKSATVREVQEETGIVLCTENLRGIYTGCLPLKNGWRKLTYFCGTQWEMPERIIFDISEIIGFGWFTHEEALELNLGFKYHEVLERNPFWISFGHLKTAIWFTPPS